MSKENANVECVLSSCPHCYRSHHHHCISADTASGFATVTCCHCHNKFLRCIHCPRTLPTRYRQKMIDHVNGHVNEVEVDRDANSESSELFGDSNNADSFEMMDNVDAQSAGTESLSNNTSPP